MPINRPFVSMSVTIMRSDRQTLHRAISAPRPRPLKRIDHPFHPVLQDIRDVADGVAVREEIPATGSVAVVVEPGAEDEVCGGAEEDAVATVSIHNTKCLARHDTITYIIISQVKNPQCPPDASSSLSLR